MNGKELLLVLAGTGVAAAAGGVASARFLAAPPAQSQDTAVLDRLDALAHSLDETRTVIDESRDEIGSLSGRLEAVESGLWKRSGTTPAAPSGRRRVDVSGLHAADVETSTDGGEISWSSSDQLPEGAEDAIKAGLAEALKGMNVQMGDGGAVQLRGSIVGEDGRLTMLGGLQKALELRRLPEEERWQKARDEVGLNDMQVEEIRSALAARDKAIDESMVVERDEDDGARRISVRRMDMEKTQEANAAYHKRVDELLNDQQRKSWHDGGYDNAFGRGAMGAATVISIGTVTQPAEK